MDTTDTTDTTDTKSTDRRYSQRSRYCRDRCGLTGIKNFGLMVMEAMAAKTGYSRTLRLKDKSWRHVSLLKWTRFHQRKRQERPWESIMNSMDNALCRETLYKTLTSCSIDTILMYIFYSEK
jgi:hypothetical protein